MQRLKIQDVRQHFIEVIQLVSKQFISLFLLHAGQINRFGFWLRMKKNSKGVWEGIIMIIAKKEQERREGAGGRGGRGGGGRGGRGRGGGRGGEAKKTTGNVDDWQLLLR